MCLSIPAKVEKINGETAICSVGKSTYEASLQMLELEEVKIGDYLLIHTGFAIQKLDTEDAEETLKTFEEFKTMNDQLDQEERETGNRIV
jgi:hydrogenase expression/formation protein HypC